MAGLRWTATSVPIQRGAHAGAACPGRLLHPEQQFGTLAERLPENQAGRSKRLGQEVLGLRWSDVDLEKRTLRVRTALQWLRGDEPKLVEPKTRQSRRTLPLPAMIIDQLRAHCVRQEED